MSLPSLVVLDLAGTTVRDDGEVPAAFRAVLDEHGVRVTDHQLVGVRGSSKREAIARLLPPGADHDRLAKTAFAAFTRHLGARYRASAQPVPGARDTIEWLRGQGVRVALNTGFDRHTTALLLGVLGWDQGVADAVVCGDDVVAGRPAPFLIQRAMALTGVADAASIANVGDTTLDLEAGRNAGAGWNIGVTSGAHGRDLLERAPHTHLIEGIDTLPTVFGVHFPRRS
jgi:phosphonatase-like hydrolase